jgi:uncharacterized membrane protein (Fun14 family)
MVTIDPAGQVGFVETIKNSMQPETVAQKIGIHKNALIDIGVYGAIGFIMGYLLKKYSEYFISLVLFIIGLILLQQFDYVSFSINSYKMHEALGLQDMPMVGDAYGSLLWEWIRTHVVSSSSFAVGFLIGIKIG